MNLYKIDGGIGKNIAFTALIKELAERDGEDIAIESAYPDVFIDIPGVGIIYNSGDGKDHTKFYRHFDKVFASDPYIGTFFKGNVNLLSAWREQLGLNPVKELSFPVLTNNISEEEDKRISEILGSKKYFIIQISGGQSPYAFNDQKSLPEYQQNHMTQGRNMGKMDELYSELQKKFPEHTIVQFALPNEPQLKGAVQIPAHYRTWFNIFEHADFFVGIDSMMAHAMAVYKKPGIVFWDMNNAEQFGWFYDGVNHYNSSLPNGVHINKQLAETSVKTLHSYLNA